MRGSFAGGSTNKGRTAGESLRTAAGDIASSLGCANPEITRRSFPFPSKAGVASTTPGCNLNSSAFTQLLQSPAAFSSHGANHYPASGKAIHMPTDGLNVTKLLKLKC